VQEIIIYIGADGASVRGFGRRHQCGASYLYAGFFFSFFSFFLVVLAGGTNAAPAISMLGCPFSLSLSYNI